MTKSFTALALAAGLSLPAAAAEPGLHDGTWTVQLVTESGLCGATRTYPVAIRGGQVSPVSASGTRISGRVGPDGAVGLAVSSGGASGTASGRLGAGTGSGTWKAAALCSGRWTARRSDLRTAQAAE